jgi:hypothetical protein
MCSHYDLPFPNIAQSLANGSFPRKRITLQSVSFAFQPVSFSAKAFDLGLETLKLILEG